MSDILTIYIITETNGGRIVYNGWAENLDAALDEAAARSVGDRAWQEGIDRARAAMSVVTYDRPVMSLQEAKVGAAMATAYMVDCIHGWQHNLRKDRLNLARGWTLEEVRQELPDDLDYDEDSRPDSSKRTPDYDDAEREMTLYYRTVINPARWTADDAIRTLKEVERLEGVEQWHRDKSAQQAASAA